MSIHRRMIHRIFQSTLRIQGVVSKSLSYGRLIRQSKLAIRLLCKLTGQMALTLMTWQILFGLKQVSYAKTDNQLITLCLGGKESNFSGERVLILIL